jgi:hypothetical protein
LNLSPSIPTGSGSCPLFYLFGNWGSFLEVKWLGSEADHLPSLVRNNEWNYTCTSPNAFMTKIGKFYVDLFRCPFSYQSEINSNLLSTNVQNLFT